ncbi:Carboxy-terminal processing protease CtpB [Anoxybacillus sp. P3H1B]|uniref:S41 family peptidase n=1 Tax=Anoxybacillus sp. P3H1B TaxID=1769293 RepID=UPI0007999344|nr:S41 family peptidase [Anoxybacillus sp. P3H1B]KXG08966.1 Carboxy-terminal processing protease CtpB [Anoxybacillus sp. P3H1B]
MRKSVRNFLILFIFLFPLAISAWNVSANTNSALDQVRQYIREYYVDQVSEEILKEPTPQEIVQHLDQYSAYMTAEEYQQFLDSVNMEFVGIGIEIGEDPGGIKVLSVLKDGPAAKAGLLAGDVITEVDGQSVSGHVQEQATILLTGQEGTTVQLKVFRLSTNEELTLNVTREKIDWPNVEFAKLAGNIGYIRLYSFDNESVKDMEQAIRCLSGVKGWIFDLRDNPGGYVDAAQQILGFFPNVSKAFQLRDRSNQPKLYASIPQSIKMKGPISVLVNSLSASASEMLAAAVKDQRAATLYGQQTFGKGSMQQIFELSDGSVLKLTVARFFSPSGTRIHDVGVKPNVVTAVNKELAAAHHDLIVKQLDAYQSLGKLRNVPINKMFTIKFSRHLSISDISKLGIKLYELGGQEIPVTVKVNKGTELMIKPNRLLTKGSSYILVVPPTVKSKEGIAMKKGLFLEFSVAK